MRQITDKQLRAKEWIEKYLLRNCTSPSGAELAKGLGTSETSANALMNQLVRRGHATRIQGVHRSFRLIQDPMRRQRPATIKAGAPAESSD
jgi:biotin operon repressor